MKKLIGSDIGDYLFNPVARTITLIDLPQLDLSNILVITNVTAGVMLYNFADPSLGGVLSNGVLTLEFDTSTHNYEDTLQIWADIPSFSAVTGLSLENYKSPSDSNCCTAEGICSDYTMDTNLMRVFGTAQVSDGDSISVKNRLRRFPKVVGVLGAIGAEIRIPCEGANTVSIQVAGTWTGTLTFQATINGADFLTVQTQPIGGGIAATTTTGVGGWIVNCSTFAYVRVLCSAAMTGNAQVVLVADAAAPPAPNVAFPTTQVTTSTNLDAAIGSTSLYTPALTELAQQVVAPVVSPTQPTAYAAPRFSSFPQKFRRLRVQIGGSTDLPCKQEEGTNRLEVAVPDIRANIEELLLQQILTNQLLAQAFNLPLPYGMVEIK